MYNYRNNFIIICTLSFFMFNINSDEVLSKIVENSLETNLNNSTRSGKFFGVGLVRFENGLCTANNSLQGTCYTRRQCRDVGGVASGTCARGIGVCCIVQESCGNSSSNNNTYFVSPNYPSTFTASQSCAFTVQKCNADICQIRIDFLAFSLAQPTANGACTTDALLVVGGAGPSPVLCGDNSGQHIYVDFNGNASIQLVFNTGAASPKAWNLKISQIGCNCPAKAPTGCLQYFTALNGNVKSFNYGATGPQVGTRQLTNQNYGVCVEMQPGYCSIRWSQSANDIYSFTVSGNSFLASGMNMVGMALNDGMCTADFVVIPNPSYVNAALAPPNTDRFCGNGFLPVTTSSKPFVLTVVTNGDEVNDMGNRGFCLMFAQQRCAGALFG